MGGVAVSFGGLRTGLLDSRLRGNDGLGPFDKLRVSGGGVTEALGQAQDERILRLDNC